MPKRSRSTTDDQVRATSALPPPFACTDASDLLPCVPIVPPRSSASFTTTEELDSLPQVPLCASRSAPGVAAAAAAAATALAAARWSRERIATGAVRAARSAKEPEPGGGCARPLRRAASGPDMPRGGFRQPGPGLAATRTHASAESALGGVCGLPSRLRTR